MILYESICSYAHELNYGTNFDLENKLCALIECTLITGYIAIKNRSASCRSKLINHIFL
jgi:hypothetical protein